MCRTVHGWFGVAPQVEFFKVIVCGLNVKQKKNVLKVGPLAKRKTSQSQELNLISFNAIAVFMCYLYESDIYVLNQNTNFNLSNQSLIFKTCLSPCLMKLN